MKDLVKKVALGLATGALVAQSMILPAFAEITVVVSGNGSDTKNDVKFDQDTSTTVNQSNTAIVENDVDAKANTGGNDADDNTGADVNIDTGNADATVVVENKLNSNEASVDCGGCPTDVNVEISGNGTDSDNKVDLKLDNTTWVKQDNFAKVENDVEVKADSGHNDANDNTGGTIDIDTGTADALAVVLNKLNANVAHIGSNGQGALELKILGNGSYSKNDIKADLNNTVTLDQDNWASVENDVEVKANTGKNDANDNTGGYVSIDTGDADAGALVDTMANFNLAHVEDCCEFDGLVKIAGNGTDSDSKVDLKLDSTLYATQDNFYKCGGGHWFPWWGDKGIGLFGEGRWGRDKDCDVDAKANTGYNDVEDNTGDPGSDPSIDTGNASTEVEVSNEANSNVFSTGDAMPDFPDLDLDGEVSMELWVALFHLLMG